MHDLREQLFKIFVIFGVLNLVKLQDFASNQKLAEDCVGKTLQLSCPPSASTTYTITIDESFYAVKSNGGTGCSYASGDCRENVKLNNAVSAATYSYTASQLITLSTCQGKRAEFLHIRYKCIPITSTLITTNNVCSGSDNTILSDNGFIISPNYPSYSQVPNLCTRKIQSPANKVIKLRFIELKIKAPDATNSCPNDYVRIDDTTGIYFNCGTDRPSYDNRLCSSVVYVSYLAATANVLLAKGFKIYYEFADRSTQPDCSTATVDPPVTLPSGVTTVTTTTTLPLVNNFVASAILTLQVCRGEIKTINSPPANYYNFFIETVLGVPTSLTCESYNSNHCTGPYTNPLCSNNGLCLIPLLSDISVGDCSNQKASYMYVTYRQIPIVTSSNYTLCDSGNIIAQVAGRYGIITSPRYPNWDANINCAKKIEATSGNVIRVYLNDLAIDGKDQANECTNSFVSVTEKDQTKKFCGSKVSSDKFWYYSCSNSVEIAYKSSTQNNFYRGFNMYFEVVPANGIVCPDDATVPVPTLPTTTISTTPQPSVSSITSQIFTEGGNALGKPCVFPFQYNGQSYFTCINVEQPQYWCATTSNYDQDKERGNCKLGLTSTVGFDLCPSNQEKFYCPRGYVVYIQSAEFVVTSDKSCNYNKKTCSESAISTVKSQTAGLESASVVHLSRTLASCQNQKSDVLHVEFSCVPDSAAGIDIYTMGSVQSVNTVRGILQTPNYPSYQLNLNNQININVNGANKLVYLYNVNTYIQAASLLQVCQADKITVNDNIQEPFVKCGSDKTDLLYQSCSNQVSISVVTGSSSSLLYKGSKLYYEIVDKDPNTLCPEVTTPTTPATGPTTSPTITTEFKPQYVINEISSPLETLSFCRNGILDILNPNKINCPNSYVIVIRRSFYGITRNNVCSYINGDCVSFKDNQAYNNCNGRQSCAFFDFGTSLPECENKQSSYLQVEYECIPIGLPFKNMCGQTFSTKSGIIQTNNYPSYSNQPSCKVTINTTPSINIIKAYIIDMSIQDCNSQDRLEFYDSFNLTEISYCGQQSAILAVETCTSTLNINVRTTGNPDGALKGVLIYYEAIPKPPNFICTSLTLPPTTTTGSTTLRPAVTTTTTTIPANVGLSLPTAQGSFQFVTCSSATLSCPNDYVIILISSEYATNSIPSVGCAYSPLDCFETTTSFNLGCSGKQSCPVTYIQRTLTSCNRQTSKYLFITYQCVPVRNAGRPNTNQNINLCSGTDKIAISNSAVIVESPNYPNYPSSNAKCIREIEGPTRTNLKVYMTNAGFRAGNLNCANVSDYVQVSDCKQSSPIQCGSSLFGKLLLESVSNKIIVDFSAIGSSPSSLLKGAQLYIEAFSSNITCDGIVVPPIVTPPFDFIGTTSPSYHLDICALTEQTIQCPANYFVLVQEEHFVHTGRGCNHTINQCEQPTDLAYQKCSSQQQCLIYVPNTPLVGCQNLNADYLDVEYICLPANLLSIRQYTCGSDRNINAKSGYLLSPQYPLYPKNGVNCEFNIQKVDRFGFNVYIIDLLLSDPDQNGNCADYLKINDNLPQCSYDQPRLVYSTKNDALNISFKSLPTDASVSELRGFKLYFEAFSLVESTLSTTTTTRGRISTINFEVITNMVTAHHSKVLMGVSLGIGLPLIALVISIVIWLNRHGRGYSNIGSSLGSPTIEYSKKKNGDNEDLRAFENPNFS